MRRRKVRPTWLADAASNHSGFSLIETLVATVIMATALVTLAQLMAVSTRSNMIARSGTNSAILAQQKMEQLRGLTWGFDTVGLPITDTSTDTAAIAGPAGCPIPQASGVASGLAPSPAGTLASNVDGYVDYVDNSGCLLGGGSTVIFGTAFIRRWSIEPLPTNPNNTLIIQVLVTRFRDRGTADSGNVQRLPEEARMIMVKTRKTT